VVCWGEALRAFESDLSEQVGPVGEEASFRKQLQKNRWWFNVE
jgi:hypothetical protein